MGNPTTVIDDDTAMGLALSEAAKAAEHGDVPVGAVAVRGGAVIAARHNEREQRADPTAHAELLVLADAARATGGWRLSDVTLFVTLEPCPMCAGGLVAARVSSAGLRRGRFQSRGVRVALQPVRRSPSQPRSRRRVRGAGRRVGHPALRVLRQPTRRIASPAEGCESGRIGRSRKPLCPFGYRGFESHSLRFCDVARHRRPMCQDIVDRQNRLVRAVAGSPCVGSRTRRRSGDPSRLTISMLRPSMSMAMRQPL